MLSIFPNSFPNETYQYGHQRQNSSPTVIDPRKAFSPATAQPTGPFHRRGSSYNSPMQPGTPTYYPGTPTRIKPELHDNTNPQQTLPNQQSIQGTQQQQFLARPGQQTDYFNQYSQQTTNSNTAPQQDYGRPNSIHTPSDRASNSSLEDDLKELLRKHNATDQDLASMLLEQGNNGLNQEQAPAVPDKGTIAGACSHHQTAGTDGGAPVDRLQERPLRPLLQRPSTPTNRMSNGKYLLTPETTPASGGRFREGECPPTLNYSSPTKDENATLKAPPYMQRGLSHDLFTRPDPFAASASIASPPPSAPLIAPTSFGDLNSADLMGLSNMKLENMPQEAQSFQSSPVTDYLSCASESFQSSPVMNFMQYDEARTQSQDMALFADLTNLSNLPSERSSVSGPTLMARTDSNSASSPEASSYNPPLVDTGIEASQIRAYIQDPEQPGGKWTCNYPECGKKFGRKENIKSHVQTHLGDRQWLCRHCHKCFVRLHDLKRHEKIHSGYKPHACKCGHTFARQDALTRHRQRGVCIGAIEGAIRKEVKRGRPRKARPDDEERLDKAQRARQRVIEKKHEGAGSVTASDSSVCSFPSPPAMDELDGGFDMSRDSSKSYYGTPPELDLDSGLSAFESDVHTHTQPLQLSDNRLFDLAESAEFPPLDNTLTEGMRDALGLDSADDSSKGVDILKLFNTSGDWSAESFETWSGLNRME